MFATNTIILILYLKLYTYMRNLIIYIYMLLENWIRWDRGAGEILKDKDRIYIGPHTLHTRTYIYMYICS